MITIEPFNFIGIAIKTSNDDINKLSQDMQSLWNKFMSENIMALIPNKISNEIYCAYTDYEGDYTKPYYALLGSKVKNIDHIPDSLTGKSFSGGKYIKKIAKGNILAGIVFDAWKDIWTMDTPRSYIADFEVYGDRAQNPENAEIEILVGVKKI
jgi:predicted transcriptional regulator YdeE